MPIQLTKRYKDWKPVKHSIFKDEELASTIHEIGHQTVPFLSDEALQRLRAIFEEEHDFDVQGGGMFYSLYSKDKAYRKRIHEQMEEVLTPFLNQHFKDYKNVINFFVVKLPGEKSEFLAHQDTTGLDEFSYSPLSLWIPLEDMKENNGALAVIEKTHWFFSPYRGVSIPFPFKKLADTVKKYIQPLYIKAGEALFFDNRIIHSSMPNSSDKARVAIVCGLFPKEAKFMNCYQKREPELGKIELFEHNDNYLLEYPHFFYNCTDRPVSGKLINEVDEFFPEMESNEFETLCELNNIPERNILNSVDMNTDNCQMIAEPDGVNRFEEEKKSWWKALLGRN